MKNHTLEYISTTLSYDPETGIFTRIGFCPDDLTRNRPDIIGAQAGSLTEGGYVEISVGNRAYARHRLAFLFMTGSMPDYVDHKDGNRANNKWENLRACDMSQNMANRGPTVRSTTGVKGVYLCKKTGRYRAQIMVNYKTIHLGRFRTIEEAGQSYRAAALKYFGEFARV